MNTFPFVPVNGFTPNNSGWSTIGKIDSWNASANRLRYTFVFGSRSLYIEVIGASAYRLRFNPAAGASYTTENSTAVVSRDLGLSGLVVDSSQSTPSKVIIDTGTIQIQVALDSFYVQVYRGAQLISQDAPGQGVLYIPGQEVVAIMKSSAPNANYLGLGEKAGEKLLKNDFTYTFFNFDNYTYSGPSESDGGLGTPGPLNPSVPLYCSIPFLIENNPMVTPGQPFAGSPFAVGTFLDNPGQSYANISANDYSDMFGKFYLGALYNELDTYFFAGNGVADILKQYTTLTGRAPMPPRYAFGFQQGAYGYYDRYKLSAAANGYRAARIPCDGLHIDVDFQDNYRTFTHSEMKFPNCKELFKDLHTIGFKMSTNITPIITDNELNQEGVRAPYEEREALIADNALIYNTRYGSGESPDEFLAGVFYGNNRGNNPYPSPPNQFNSDGLMPLAAPGNYPDFGLSQVREAWGAQYKHLIQDLGLDMIWQDMTCPALDANLPPDKMYFKTFPQNLMMAQEQVDESGNTTVVYKPNAQLHNSYVNNLLDATWNGINKLAPQRRNFIIARGGYAGMQRYAGLWTGDSASSWDFLKINLPEVLNLGLSGVPISGCDIGGFANGSGSTSASTIVGGTVVGGITNYELLTRWMQLGSFLPWYRNHYDGYNKQFQEAYAYAEPVPSNCRKYVELRYRMMQVYYDAMYQWTQSGLPIVRPLFLNDPTDGVVYQHLEDQFFVGGDVLVAPILFQAETANPPVAPVRGIYLPSGNDWYAFQNNKTPLPAAVSGGSYISDYYADLSLVPIYIRAGAILPFGELEQWVGELEVNPITLNCYPGPDRWTDAQAYEMYQDDGVSVQAEQSGTYRLSRVYQQTQNQNGAVTRNVRIARVYDQYQPPANFNYIAILGSTTTAQALYRDGQLLTDVKNSTALSASTADAWYWNQSLNTVFVKVYDEAADTTVSANY
jgi:alpha-glucosidase